MTSLHATSDHGHVFWTDDAKPRPILDVPSADDAQWWAEQNDDDHATEPTPVEALIDVIDHGIGPWWETAPHDPELDDAGYWPTDEAIAWERMLDAMAEGLLITRDRGPDDFDAGDWGRA